MMACLALVLCSREAIEVVANTADLRMQRIQVCAALANCGMPRLRGSDQQ
jgi:hypothetical protein